MASPSTLPPSAALTAANLVDPHVVARLSRLEIRPTGPVTGSYTGMHKSPHRGSSVEFAEYRKYAPGDEPKHIDWRVFAKTDRFYVKEFEADTNLRCHLVLDASGSMAFGSRGTAKFDYARRMAATLAHLLTLQGDAVGLQCFDAKLRQDLPARNSPRHFRQVLDTMAGAKASGETDLPKVLHDLAEGVSRRAMIIVFSDLFTDLEPLLSAFQHMRFRQHDLAVFHLMDPQELAFDFDRTTRFADLESNASLVAEPAAIRDLYLREINAWLGNVRTGCLSSKVDYHFVDTARPYDAVLSDFLLKRRGK